ncbi:hypothetical protein H4Q26_014877 [Puccinia striiformis f. sp. tritici PST-130]|nr:hypothetical protein H4Q26_014877 [Puccinia striiformis f. sp. tritici PST-130]
MTLRNISAPTASSESDTSSSTDTEVTPRPGNSPARLTDSVQRFIPEPEPIANNQSAKEPPNASAPPDVPVTRITIDQHLPSLIQATLSRTEHGPHTLVYVWEADSTPGFVIVLKQAKDHEPAQGTGIFSRLGKGWKPVSQLVLTVIAELINELI